MELLILLQTLRLDSAARITAVIPYLCYGRSDKKDQPRVPITGRLVADIDQLEVNDGEIMAIFGPSGAGKSTLLRLLNFLEYPDEGRVAYTGQVSGPGMELGLRRQVTTVFQRPALLQHRRVQRRHAVEGAVGQVAALARPRAQRPQRGGRDTAGRR